MEPQPSLETSEVQLVQPREILVDEDALSPLFKAQLEALLQPLALLILAALAVSRFRRSSPVNLSPAALGADALAVRKGEASCSEESRSPKNSTGVGPGTV